MAKGKSKSWKEKVKRKKRISNVDKIKIVKIVKEETGCIKVC